MAQQKMASALRRRNARVMERAAHASVDDNFTIDARRERARKTPVLRYLMT